MRGAEKEESSKRRLRGQLFPVYPCRVALVQSTVVVAVVILVIIVSMSRVAVIMIVILSPR
jgi:hypothetical protein